MYFHWPLLLVITTNITRILMLLLQECKIKFKKKDKLEINK